MSQACRSYMEFAQQGWIDSIKHIELDKLIEEEQRSGKADRGCLFEVVR